MKKIIALFNEREQANKVLDALNELQVKRDEIEAFTRDRAEIKDTSKGEPGDVMLVLHVDEEVYDPSMTILRKSDAIEINTNKEKEWEPDPIWLPEAFPLRTDM